ncbi:MAG: EFR1 family ferrodoxin [Synergistaceae bacterium]|jgi:ferredoxin/flavodoxin|nr:EFR1 family ferrodoxin [Synergistaceae bacterium]
MESHKVVIAVFTGTGNTLLMARALADELDKRGRDVSLAPMERPEKFILPKGAALGLATPLACFSTYPTAWCFLDSLPEGKGREAFFLATMGGASGGMDGPIRRVLQDKGYKPVGSLTVVMPSNYANKTLPVEKNRQRIEKSETIVRKYAGDLCAGNTTWASGGFLSPLFARLARGRRSLRLFYKFFPLAVDTAKCIGCGICHEICPEKNITLINGRSSIGKSCQSCQRCVAFCPSEAISVPGKPAERYRSVSIKDIRALLG